MYFTKFSDGSELPKRFYATEEGPIITLYFDESERGPPYKEICSFPINEKPRNIVSIAEIYLNRKL